MCSWAAATATTTEDVTKHVTENIAKISIATAEAAATKTTRALLKCRMAVLVISGFLLRIGQNFIRFFDFFKLFRRTSISRVAVRWYFIARRLYAFLISRSEASRPTPNTS